MPLVSVIMPSLNVGNYIEKCLASVMNQSLKDIEIICVDAGSTDGTLEIIKKYAELDQRIVVISSEVRSYGYQVNLGINSAKGKYIAILETDDYIDSDMYRQLYEVAQRDNLDYAKADFDTIYEYDSKHTGRHAFIVKDSIFQKGCNEQTGYNKVFSAKEYFQIFLKDMNVWSGIYKREFLNKYNIRFNESAGAAFQDIGFKMLVFTYADRIECIDYSGYRYRMERDGCSSCNNNVLKYAYQEFKRLIEDICIDDTKTFKWVILRMVDVFICEYRKLITKTYNAFDVTFYKEYIATYYNWFKNKLSYYISVGLVEQADLGAKKYNDLLKLLEEEQEYREELINENIAKKDYWNKITARISDNPVVVVSYGAWGKNILRNLIKSDYRVEAVCDNNPELWNELAGGIIPIKSISETIDVNKDNNVVYIIANKKHGEELKRQLLECGVNDKGVLILREALS